MPSFDYQKAKASGYTDQEIAQYLQQQKTAGVDIWIDKNQYNQVNGAEVNVPKTEEEYKQNQSTSGKVFSGVSQALPNLAAGMVKGAASTAYGAGKLLEKGISKITGQPQLTTQIAGKSLGEEKPEFLKPQGVAQKVGFGAEQIGEFFVPGGTSTKIGMKAAELIPKVAGAVGKVLPKATSLATRATTEAGLFGGQTAVQQGEFGQEAKTGALLGAAFPVAGATLKLAKIPVKATGGWLMKKAESLYQSALKPSTSKANIGNIPDIIKTGLDEAVVLSERGVEKTAEKINQMEEKLGLAIEEAGAKGGKIKTSSLKSYVNEAKKWFENISDVAVSEQSVRQIDDIYNNFAKKYGKNIPVKVAQEIKTATYRWLKNAYGEVATAVKEGNKQLVRGLKEGIVDVAPLVGDINPRLRKLYQFDEALTKAQGRVGNLNLLGLGTKIIGAGIGGKWGAILGAINQIAGSPGVKSRNAIILNKIGKLMSGLSPAEKSEFFAKNPTAKAVYERIFGSAERTLEPTIKGTNRTLDSSFKAGEIPPTIRSWEPVKIEQSTGQFNPTIINPDLLKKEAKDYNPANHEKYAEMAKKQYADSLKNNQNPIVKFTAGGSGSGKSELILEKIKKDFDGIIVDGVLGNFESASKKIQQALDAGKQVEINAILPRLNSALKFVQKRALETGRDVPLDAFIDLHKGFVDTIPKLLKKFPEIKINLLDTRKLFSEQVVRETKFISDKNEIINIFNKVKYDKDKLLKELSNVKYSGLIIKDLGKNLPEISNLINEGGITWDVIKNKSLAGEKLFSVSPYPERSKLIKGQVKESDLKQYILDNIDLLKNKNHRLGGWFDTESKQTYLDVATTISDKIKAIEAGKKYNQKSIADLYNIVHDFDNAFIDTGGTGETISNLPSIKERIREFASY